MATNKQQKSVQNKIKEENSRKGRGLHLPSFQASGIGAFAPNISGFADEVAKMVVARLPSLMQGKSKKKTKTVKRPENALFLDTSAIIDGRIFDVISVGLISGEIIVPERILLELKHIADSSDLVKKERGRKGLESLEKLKKSKGIKLTILDQLETKEQKKPEGLEVDEVLIKTAKQHKGRIVTCDYNLEKKARIQGIIAINMNAVANVLKITAVPGETLSIHLLHVGKDPTQGVGYLDDGTMIVVEDASADVGRQTNIVVVRVIQTDAGRILFAKKI